MEVAVFTSLSRSRQATLRRLLTTLTRALLAGSLLLGVGAAAGGCVDSITPAHDYRADGVKFYNDGNYNDAAGAFSTALSRYPADYTSQYYLGRTYEKLGALQKAIQCYRSSLETMPLTAEGKRETTLRADVFDALAHAIARSDGRAAEIDALAAKASKSQATDDYVLLARVYRYSGDVDSALDAYNRATLLDGRNFDLLKEHGLFLAQLQQSVKAQAVLTRAYKIKADDSEVNAALRAMGLTPGPALKEPNELAQPLIPRGPLPAIRLPGQPRQDQSDDAAQTQQPSGTASPEAVQVPRD
jgi:Tfp pilus assembly protein PilF